MGSLAFVAVITVTAIAMQSIETTEAHASAPELVTAAPAGFVPTPPTQLLAAGGPSIADVTEQALPSVVNVYTTKSVKKGSGHLDPFFNSPGSPGNGNQSGRYASALGSGVIVSDNGYIITNNHVIDGATDIRVALHDGRELEATLIGADAKSDVAVLKIDAPNIEPMKLADSDSIRLGEIVLAIGNPFGMGHSVTMGIVSATGRANVGIVDYEDFIQTDAAINPGNSGGALITMDGELAGINTAILSRSGGYQGIGFAIPANMVGPIMSSLIADGKVTRGWLGVVIRTVNTDLAGQLGLHRKTGVLVSEVADKSPAATAGLEKGDIIVSIGGESTMSSAELRNRVAMSGANVEVDLEVDRGGDTHSVKVVLGELP